MSAQREGLSGVHEQQALAEGQDLPGDGTRDFQSADQLPPNQDLEDSDMTSAESDHTAEADQHASVHHLQDELEHLANCATRLAEMAVSLAMPVRGFNWSDNDRPTHSGISKTIEINTSACCAQDLQSGFVASHRLARTPSAPSQNYHACSEHLQACLNHKAMLQQELVDLKALQQGGITECQKLVSRVHTDLANLDISLEHKSMGDFDEGTLHQAVHNLYSMHTALMEHAQQMSTEANAMREQHAKILEQKEDSHNAELAKLEHQRSLLANQLEAAKYFKQQTPRGLERVFNYCQDTDSSPPNTSPSKVTDLLTSDVVAGLLEKYSKGNVVMNMLPIEQQDSLNRLKAGPELRRRMRNGFVSLVNLHLYKQIWCTETAADESVDAFMSKLQAATKLTRLLGGQALQTADTHTLDIINRYLLSYTKECTYWQEKCKDGSIKLSDSVQLLASNLADNLLPESIMRTNEIQELLDAIVSGAISARIAAEAVHPLYTLFVPVNGSICTCPGIRIGPEFGKLHVDDTLCVGSPAIVCISNVDMHNRHENGMKLFGQPILDTMIAQLFTEEQIQTMSSMLAIGKTLYYYILSAVIWHINQSPHDL